MADGGITGLSAYYHILSMYIHALYREEPRFLIMSKVSTVKDNEKNFNPTLPRSAA
jgi:hypothetical protein